MFAKEFIKVLAQFPDGTVFVDLFGGSGLLSHITKCVRPDATTVVYNDFDNYRCRLVNIPATNVLLSDLRRIAEGEPRNKRITGEVRDKMFARIEREEKEHGYVDYITVSASLLFAMKYVTSLEGMKKEAIYNRIRQTDYPEAKDYLEGLTITSEDYKEVFKRYKDVPGVVFLVDPPYLSTEVGTYKMFWRLADYLDVLTVLKGHSFVYFTSNKASILELCDWMDRNSFVGSPFKECRKVELPVKVKGAFWICTLALIALFSVPYLEGAEPVCTNGVYEAFCIVVAFPILVWLGASGSTTDKQSTQICKFLGDISYPIYVIHYPLMYLFYAWLIKNQLYTLGETWQVALCVYALCIVLAYLSLKFYDEPLRKYLAKRFLSKKR